ncbi:hypothetical protein, conserved [Eimeria necatrix]|uniref:Uncharacterized protein n=1 Tax=Eimeria necatrix TaxID=51315 RepID=U6MVM5_9EIME|nr:hypothetical protein, conserved [Eimeria necatrix]CDJ67043.1 hypothetical protein, conserved [Eimeria necatrix]
MSEEWTTSGASSAPQGPLTCPSSLPVAHSKDPRQASQGPGSEAFWRFGQEGLAIGSPQGTPRDPRVDAGLTGAPHETLWRPRPEAAPSWHPQKEHFEVGASKAPSTVSSFVWSGEGGPCESTAPSEGVWPGPGSPVLTGSPFSVSDSIPAATAEGVWAPAGVEVHHLSPASSFEPPEKELEAEKALMLPSPAAAAAAPTTCSSSSGVSPLVQFLRASKTLKMSLTQTMEMQQQTLQLLLLHPQLAPPDLDAPCCWCSTAAADAQQQPQYSSCVVLLQIEMLQQLLQQCSSRLQQQQEDILEAEGQLQQQQQQQQQDPVTCLLPHWQQQQQQQQLAAAAAELRIRRSVLKHQCSDFQQALLLQQQLQQEANARWLLEAADHIRSSFADSPTADLANILRPGSSLNPQITQGLVGNQLSEKRSKLLQLEEKLKELQQLATMLQQQQQKRQQQQQQLDGVTTQTKQLTAAACTDLLLAHKYRKQSLKRPQHKQHQQQQQ